MCLGEGGFNFIELWFDGVHTLHLYLLATEVGHEDLLIGEVEILVVGDHIPDLRQVRRQSISREISLVLEILEDEILIGTLDQLSPKSLGLLGELLHLKVAQGLNLNFKELLELDVLHALWLRDVLPNRLQVAIQSLLGFSVIGLLIPISNDEDDILHCILLEQF